MLAEEIGGIAIYLDLLASLLGISLEEAIIKTFNQKSLKYNFDEFLPEIDRQQASAQQEGGRG